MLCASSASSSSSSSSVCSMIATASHLERAVRGGQYSSETLVVDLLNEISASARPAPPVLTPQLRSD